MTNENLKIEEHHIDMKTSNNVECIEDYLQIYKRIIREIKMTIMMMEQYINTNVIVNIIYKEVKKNELKIQCEFWFFVFLLLLSLIFSRRKRKSFSQSNVFSTKVIDSS